MAYFKKQEEAEQEPERLFIHPVEDDFDDDDEGDYDAGSGPDEIAPEAGEKREANLRMAFGLGNFLGVIIGAVVILVLLSVLISLINWVHADIYTFFALWINKS